MKFAGKELEGGSDINKIYIGYGDGLDAALDTIYSELPEIQRASEYARTRTPSAAVTEEQVRAIVEEVEEETQPPIVFTPIPGNTPGLPRYPAAFDRNFFCGNGFAIDYNGEVEDWQNGTSVSVPLSSLGTGRLVMALRDGSNFTHAHSHPSLTTNGLRVYRGSTHTTYNYGYVVAAGQINNTLYFVASRKAGVNGTYVITVASDGTVADTNYNATLALGGLQSNGNWSARAGDDTWAISTGSSVLVNGTTLLTSVSPTPLRTYTTGGGPEDLQAFKATCIGNGKWFWYVGGSTDTLYVMDLSTGAVTLYTAVNDGLTVNFATIGWAGGNYVVMSWQNGTTTGGYKITNGVSESNNSMPSWDDTGSSTDQNVAAAHDGSEFIVRYFTTASEILTLDGYTL